MERKERLKALVSGYPPTNPNVLRRWRMEEDDNKVIMYIVQWGEVCNPSHTRGLIDDDIFYYVFDLSKRLQ